MNWRERSDELARENRELRLELVEAKERHDPHGAGRFAELCRTEAALELMQQLARELNYRVIARQWPPDDAEDAVRDIRNRLKDLMRWTRQNMAENADYQPPTEAQKVDAIARQIAKGAKVVASSNISIDGASNLRDSHDT